MSTQNDINPSLWMKQISPSILQMDEVPLFGNAPPFPWSKLVEEFDNLFQLKNCNIKPIEMQWRDSANLHEGIGSPCSLYSSFSPLEGTLSWVMPKQDVENLMKLLLTNDPSKFTSIEPDFFHTFYKFLGAQTIQLLNKIDFDKNLSPSLHDEVPTNTQPCFCIDVEITILDTTMHGRAIIPNELRRTWKERYSDRKLGINYNSPLAQKIQGIIHLEVGKIELPSTEFAKLEPGDFIILDNCTFEPDNDKGRIMMTMNDIPLFRARLKQGSLKILEFPLYHEVISPMNTNENDEEFEEPEESEFEDQDESEFGENESFDEESTENDFSQEEITEEEEEQTTEEIEETLKENLEEEIIEEAPKETSKQTPQSPKASTPPPKKIAEKKEDFKPTELPVTIKIEVGQIQISIQKLMELQPGNVLDLDIHSENGVDLIVNGRRIGKGELLKAGDTLGVRILDLG